MLRFVPLWALRVRECLPQGTTRTRVGEVWICMGLEPAAVPWRRTRGCGSVNGKSCRSVKRS